MSDIFISYSKADHALALNLRMRVDEMLLKRRAEIEQQLERMDRGIAVVGGPGGRSVLKGGKVPPKYRVPSAKLGQVVASPDLVGWLLRSRVERKLDDFLIDKPDFCFPDIAARGRILVAGGGLEPPIRKPEPKLVRRVYHFRHPAKTLSFQVNNGAPAQLRSFF